MSEAYSSNGLEQATDGGSAEDASTEFDSKCGIKRVKLEPHDSGDTEVSPEKADIGNNSREAESEDVRRIKSEPEDGNCDDPGIENVTPGLKMLPDIKQEVVEAATTSSSPANGADVFPGNDSDSESDSQSGVARGDRRSASTDTRLYKCGLCYFSAQNMSDLKLHMKSSHAGHRPFHCDICPVAFQQHDDFVLHRRTHPKRSGRAYCCTRCPRKFTTHQALKRHMGTHPKEKPYGCNLSPSRFDCPAAMSRHIIGKHTHDYRCDRCGKGFVSFGWHRKHQASCFKSVLETAADESHEQQAPRMDYVQFEEVSAASAPAVVFSTAPAVVFSTAPAVVFFTTVSQTCLDSTPPLEECAAESVGAGEASFQQHGHLVAHRRTHPKEMKGSKINHCCTRCRQKFTSHEALKHHKGTHTKEKPYGCKECPRRFGYGANLSRHIVNKHTQNFRCDRCGKGFVSSARHRKHQASCFESVLETGSDESPAQQASRMDYVEFEKVSPESASADVFSTESTTGSQACLDSTPPREECATDSVGAGEASFQQHGHLVAHRRSHPKEPKGSERAHCCPRCPRKFTSLEALKRHKGTHPRKKPHRCNLCPRRFDSAAVMGRHMGKHTRDYRCARCGKGFVSFGWHHRHQASCFESVLETASEKSPEQQLSAYSTLDEQPSTDPLSLD